MPSKSPPRLVQCAPAVRDRRGFAGDLRGISRGFAVILGDSRLWAALFSGLWGDLNVPTFPFIILRGVEGVGEVVQGVGEVVQGGRVLEFYPCLLHLLLAAGRENKP